MFHFINEQFNTKHFSFIILVLFSLLTLFIIYLFHKYKYEILFEHFFIDINFFLAQNFLSQNVGAFFLGLKMVVICFNNWNIDVVV